MHEKQTVGPSETWKKKHEDSSISWTGR